MSRGLDDINTLVRIPRMNEDLLVLLEPRVHCVKLHNCQTRERASLVQRDTWRGVWLMSGENVVHDFVLSLPSVSQVPIQRQLLLGNKIGRVVWMNPNIFGFLRIYKAHPAGVGPDASRTVFDVRQREE
jgi:hypothetical protein